MLSYHVCNLILDYEHETVFKDRSCPNRLEFGNAGWISRTLHKHPMSGTHTFWRGCRIAHVSAMWLSAEVTVELDIYEHRIWDPLFDRWLPWEARMRPMLLSFSYLVTASHRFYWFIRKECSDRFSSTDDCSRVVRLCCLLWVRYVVCRKDSVVLIIPGTWVFYNLFDER